MTEVEEYLSRSNEYWRQALEFFSSGEIEKASELAWGSTAERIKALALQETGSLLRSHGQIHSFMTTISRQLGDEELYRLFREAESLHTNFYESHLDREDVRITLLSIEKLLTKLEALFSR
jgi:hypothetical protein